MPSRKREAELLEAMWERVCPLIPPQPQQPHGGRPCTNNKAGIVDQLRNAIRWNDMPSEFPSGVTCWRRFDRWTRLGLWKRIHEVILEELAADQEVDERFVLPVQQDHLADAIN